MPNLVGTGLNQVPTNSMLGGLAYQDPEHASIKNLDLKNLSQINSEIADTAVDVFVYDTRKDSDGGAWRKRTQNTSWYNETLGTATRGTRKEFPAVAVLVLESLRLKIYDGDDPNLPLWMEFVNTSGNLIGGSAMTAVTALNGIIVTASSGYTMETRFISDYSLDWFTGQLYEYKGNIEQRNDTLGFRLIESYGIVNSASNDVAMTVLPNAPVDSATGLPVPTIAVGTNNGVSVIKDDGTVVDVIHTSFKNMTQIFFTEDNLLAYLAANTVNQTYGFHYVKIPSGDLDNGTDGRNVGSYDVRFYNGDGRNYTPSLGSRAYGHNFIDGAIGYNDASSGGLTLLEKDVPQDYENSSIAFVNTDFNTGWMHGDCKGAFLSDAVTEKDGVNYALSALNGGTNRLSSHTYDSGDTAWQMVDNASTSNGYVNVDMRGLTIGQTYKISMTWSSNATLDSGYHHRVAHLNGLSGENGTDFTHWNKTNGSSETLTGVFIAQSVNDDDLVIYANAITLNISNFKIEETDDINGFEKLGNHDFTSNFTTEWEVKNSANTSYDATNDRVTVTSTQNYSGIQLRSTKLPHLAQGKRYIMTVDIHSITNPIRFGVVSGATKDSVNSTGSHQLMFTAQASVSEVFVEKSTGSNSTFVLNSVSIREAEEDRSVNNKGLQVFGTVTKTPVATGTDLVAYSGFSASNYLKQPYNSDLAPGTTAYSVSCWFKTGTSSGDQYIFDRNGGGAGSRNLLLIMNTSAGNANRFQWWHRDNFGNTTDIQITDKTITDNVWHQVVALNDGSTYRVYVDGEVSSVTSSVIRNVISDNNPPMFVGVRHTAGSTFMTGSMALFRYSKSAPSPEQVKKMYEDEKCLFHENAKATLYGSSDAVTALAYDDTTNLLHVGTSAGRSEFQGLSRINNTTDAVTTAISASNGLVAEQ